MPITPAKLNLIAPSILLLGLSTASHAELPEQVLFKGNQQSYNQFYYSAIEDNNIWVKPRQQQGQWQQLELPAELAGDVQEIAMDDEHIIAINSRKEIYTMWQALDSIEEFRWQKQWGFPFWNGPGHTLDASLKKWEFSVISPRQDEYYYDPAGNKIPVGYAKVSHIIGLKTDGRNVVYNDPWLATDWSYEICGPKNGQFPVHAVSASGSTTFVMGQFGDMYTRLYDFDSAGHNDFFSYSYEPVAARDDADFKPHSVFVPVPTIQLPTFDWQAQAKIQGRITDRISLHKVGKGGDERIMRVEGWNAAGQTGYYEKSINAPQSSDWQFHITGHAIEGTEVSNKPYDSSDELLLEPEGLSYQIKPISRFWAWLTRQKPRAWSASIEDFDPYCSPAKLSVSAADQTLEVTFHVREGVRIVPRQRGIDQQPFRLNGAMEISQADWDNRAELNPELQAFIAKYFDDSRFKNLAMLATADKLDVLSLLDGSPLLWSFKSN